MNGPSRCVAKVFEDKNVRVADIIGCRCAWDGCAAKFSGDMPRGWTYLLAYRGRRLVPSACARPGGPA